MYLVDYDDNDGDMVNFETYAEAQAFADTVEGTLYALDDQGELIPID